MPTDPTREAACVRHMLLELESGRVVEIACTQPGARDGCLMGYAINFSGAWDGWSIPVHDHFRMHKVVANTSRETAIEWVVKIWSPE